MKIRILRKRFAFITSAAFLLCTGAPEAVRSQTCSSPTVLTLGSALNNQTTCGKANPFDKEDACGNEFLTGEDFVFSYTPSASGIDDCISIQLTCTAYGLRGLFVFDGCPDAAGTKCIAQAVAMGNTGTSIDNLKLNAGTNYKIVVSGSSGCHSFNIAVVAGSCSTPPQGSTCANAKPVTALPFAMTGGNTYGYGNDYNEGNIDDWTGVYLNGNDYVFEYTPSSNISIGITLSNTAAYAGLFVVKGCPSDPASTLVAANGSSSTVSPELPSVLLNAGQTYYIIVSSNGMYAPSTTFNINIDVSAVNSCFNPTDISFGTTISNKTTCGAGDQFDQYDACGNKYMNGEDYVFRYTTNASNPSCVNIDMVGDQPTHLDSQ
jgi:hypothetical protein